MSTQRPIERNIAVELVRVTEAAAMAAARFLGRGDKVLVDDAAVTAMRYVLGYVRMDGVVVIGEVLVQLVELYLMMITVYGKELSWLMV